MIENIVLTQKEYDALDKKTAFAFGTSIGYIDNEHHVTILVDAGYFHDDAVGRYYKATKITHEGRKHYGSRFVTLDVKEDKHDDSPEYHAGRLHRPTGGGW